MHYGYACYTAHPLPRLHNPVFHVPRRKGAKQLTAAWLLDYVAQNQTVGEIKKK